MRRCREKAVADPMMGDEVPFKVRWMDQDKGRRLRVPYRCGWRYWMKPAARTTVWSRSGVDHPGPRDPRVAGPAPGSRKVFRRGSTRRLRRVGDPRGRGVESGADRGRWLRH